MIVDQPCLWERPNSCLAYEAAFFMYGASRYVRARLPSWKRMVDALHLLTPRYRQLAWVRVDTPSGLTGRARRCAHPLTRGHGDVIAYPRGYRSLDRARFAPRR